ncbi:extracellular solute-binding protein [Paenibacillus sp. J5C_2022]|uniref:extracellular solute-binding protein n=1 Tax=Paenibacillus sp. J5C2022 TaxID=2977129 RepID=UPI0021CF116E|nr:extracellular solute-binding protein [Paenibacillus sp. J5C2022]MCU6713032.1 extracellular solute-binding protein [Paenibacillus sp. J5C2022]
MKGRRHFSFILASVLALSLTLTACGEANNKQAEGNGGNGAGNESAAIEPLGKYDPPIDVTAARFITQDVVYPDGQSESDNAWESLYKEMGINLSYDWIVKGTDAQYFQKLNLSIASGEIPDILMVNSSQLKQLVEADMVEDLTEAFEKYASPAVKDVFQKDKMALQSATFDGKLYAIPKTEPMIGAQTPVLWVRTDWLSAMNLPEPTTWEEVLQLSEAFTTGDPDGNGQPDTFGIALSKEIINGYPSLNGFFNAYGAHPRIWKKDDSGNLTYGSIQPEVKTALGVLAELYQKGQLDKEFGVKDGSKVAESIVSDRVGLLFGPSWASQWPIQDNKKKNNEAEWRPYPIPAADGGNATVQMPFGASFYYVVKKDIDHPEVAVKMANLFLEKLYGETADYLKYGVDGEGISTAKYSLIDLFAPDKDLKRAENVAAALEKGDPAGLNPEEKSTYDKVLAYRDGGDLNFYGETYQSGPEGAMVVLQQLTDEGKVIAEGYGGAPTDTMGEKRATLDKMETETFTKIIYGALPLDQFDKFVEDWKKLGGDQITQEVNEWNASQK